MVGKIVAVEQVLEELGGFDKGALLFAAEAHVALLARREAR